MLFGYLLYTIIKSDGTYSYLFIGRFDIYFFICPFISRQSITYILVDVSKTVMDRPNNT